VAYMVMKKVIDKIKRKDWQNRLDKIKKGDWHYNKAKMQVHSEVKDFSKHFKENFWTLAVSTFGIATGLIWYEVIKSIIDEFFPNRSTLLIKFYVAILVTIISITGTYVVTRIKNKNGS
jgi:hypothetical protein